MHSSATRQQNTIPQSCLSFFISWHMVLDSCLLVSAQGSGVMHAWFLAGICMQLEIRCIIDARAAHLLYTYSSIHT